MKWDERLNMPSVEANEEVLKEAYFRLGQLSTSFSEMEEEMFELLSKLISHDWIISSYLIDRNALEKNLQLLEKINDYRGFEIDKVKDLTKLIYSIKEKRNELIHGTWTVRVLKSDHSPIIFVGSHRMMRPESIIKGKKGWASRTYKSYTFDEISENIKNIRLIIDALKELTNTLENSL